MADSAHPFALRGEEQRDGAFVRQTSRFRNWVTPDGSSGFAPEIGRYHLYVARACPWAHRTIIARRLMGLDDAISISFVDPIRDERGWAFSEPGRYEDPVNGFRLLSEAYYAADPEFSDRVTVQSFDWRTLQLVQKLAPAIPTVYLTQQAGRGATVFLDKASNWTAGFNPVDHGGSLPRAIKAAGGAIWSPYFGDVNSALISESHDLGIAVVVVV